MSAHVRFRIFPILARGYIFNVPVATTVAGRRYPDETSDPTIERGEQRAELDSLRSQPLLCPSNGDLYARVASAHVARIVANDIKEKLVLLSKVKRMLV